MLRLKVTAQNYDWGRLGEESEVGKLYAISSGKKVEQDVLYAELWMGTHPSGPSLICDVDGEPELLKEWLLKHPEALGEKVLERWQGELPFLFKVLSIAKALSIQAHPDKKLAEQLHANQGNIYKDPNHKPEMALALSNFEALCGFVTSEELKEIVGTVPELKRVLMKDDTENSLDGQHLRQAFRTIMTLEEEVVKKSSQDLILRLKKERQVRKLSSKEELALRLGAQYPDDVGVLASFFLNYIHLSPREAVYLAANIPHAYISGECIECMATSDNVVRAGLTPKFRDTETLCSMLTYEQGLPVVLNGSPVSPHTKRYSPPFEEFEVDIIDIPAGDSLDFAAIPGPSIFLVFDGIAKVTFDNRVASPVQRGDIFFLPAGKELKFLNKTEPDVKAVNGFPSSLGHWAGVPFSETRSLRVFRAGVNSKIFNS